MAMKVYQSQCLRASNYVTCAKQRSSSLEIGSRPATVNFVPVVPRKVQGLSQRSTVRLVICAAEGSGSCCGGNGNGKQSCSSHESKLPPPGIANVGAEFENMVSRATMEEFEKEYDTGEMQGTITRDVVAEVMNEMPELQR
ncbi:uncharacterized protein [Physcomitrium patens]|uniref:uncharacterized protein isoform X2 n=1 Tax=Physcomitrium patens TaxID=3218 RepID=UPI00024AE193|nr:uncharacterized protein LOC112290601 isoform X2 [Physcomitrium patens]|eukprot:XP_024392822.1 uncharacterized protein LOC112290601 isoform X2 [Physcomitrella patens]